jgi:hypothetical protein
MYVYAKENKEEGKKRKKRGKKKRIHNFLEVGLSFTLLSTSLSMRPGIATDTFLLVFILSVFQCSVLDAMPELALHH